LMAQACARALAGSLDAWHQMAERGGGNALSAVASAYLSPAHRDRPGEGCALAALGAEAARHGSPVRGTITQGVHSLVDRLTRLLPGKSKRAKRERALAIFASMIGALVLARAVDDAELSEEVLQSVLASIAHTDSPS
jgi:TetR/AcrR family transcriptional repressor of nem operon